ncbi:MAG: multidrug efflux protein [Legionellales bacterium]|nr:multidrug efflux protein [Legionellales bacterium]OUX64505.1 MAG: hypothetical protein CBE41_03100 [Gammaproteobacteria bacterium TMED281]
MPFTDFFIERPVFATVFNIIIFLVGLVCLSSVELRQYPEVKRTQIQITTRYYGADAGLIKGFITQTISNAVADVDSVDYVYASSVSGQSSVTVQLRLNADDDVAFNDVQAAVSSVSNQLPDQAQDPVIEKVESTALSGALYVAYTSDSISAVQLHEYIERSVIPRLMAISDVAQIKSVGSSDFSVRVELDPMRMRTYNVSADSVYQALTSANFISATGKLSNQSVAVYVKADTSMNEIKQFKSIKIKQSSGHGFVTLNQVAHIFYGPQDKQRKITFNGKSSVVLPISNVPNTNVITVIKNVKEELKKIQPALPVGVKQLVVYDSTIYMVDSIKEVIHTIIEASLIVILVIFLFLGSVRSTIIPVITIPLSLAGSAIGLLLLGFSLNTLTLLAAVLAIGLVVDDAIVVIENVQRYMEEGMDVMTSSKKGASTIFGAIIAMTITLAAVFAPLGFSSGIIGALFREFAFTLAFAVIISGVISITLSPMMCSLILSDASMHKPFVLRVNKVFEGLKSLYHGLLHVVFKMRYIVILVPFIVLDSLIVLSGMPAIELVPQEFSGFVFAQGYGPSNASFNYMDHYTTLLDNKIKHIDGLAAYFSNPAMSGPTVAFSGLNLTPWQDRKEITDFTVAKQLNAITHDIPGLKYQVLMMPSLPIMKSMLKQLVIKSADNPERLYAVAEKVKEEALKTGRFQFIDLDLSIDQLKYSITLNRELMNQLGVSAENVGRVLTLLMSGGHVTEFTYDQSSYYVVPKANDQGLMDIETLRSYPVLVGNKVIPLSSIATIKNEVTAQTYPQFQQLNSVTLSYLPSDLRDSKTLEVFEGLQQKYMPSSMSFDYRDQLRFEVKSGNELAFVLIGALVFIYLILSATFESFSSPFVIMMTIPLATLGAFVPMALGWSSLNMYSQIALVTLMGLITKHGILIVDFANQLLPSCADRIEAAKKSAGLRLRPILMTTLAMVLGVIPLIFAKGPGAFSRFDLGIIIMYGMSIGTVFSLFIVPVLYAVLNSMFKNMCYFAVFIGQAMLFSSLLAMF